MTAKSAYHGLPGSKGTGASWADVPPVVITFTVKFGHCPVTNVIAPIGQFGGVVLLLLNWQVVAAGKLPQARVNGTVEASGTPESCTATDNGVPAETVAGVCEVVSASGPSANVIDVDEFPTEAETEAEMVTSPCATEGRAV